MAAVLYTRYKALFKVRMTRESWQASHTKPCTRAVLMPVPFFILKWFKHHLGIRCAVLLWHIRLMERYWKGLWFKIKLAFLKIYLTRAGFEPTPSSCKAIVLPTTRYDLPHSSY